MKRSIIRQISAWLPVTLWALMIFKFSSGTVPVASNVYWQDFAVKKTGHVLLFGILTVFIYRGLRVNKVKMPKALVWSVVISTLYGASDEYHQVFTQGREAHIRDVFVDGMGSFFVATVLYYLPSRVSNNLKVLLAKFDLL